MTFQRSYYLCLLIYIYVLIKCLKTVLHSIQSLVLVFHSGLRVVLPEPPRALLRLPHPELHCFLSDSPRHVSNTQAGTTFPRRLQGGPSPYRASLGPRPNRAEKPGRQAAAFQRSGVRTALPGGARNLGMNSQRKLEHPLSPPVGYISQKPPRATTLSYPSAATYCYLDL